MKNLFDIKGKVVVLTGGCGILGRNIAHYLVEQGAKVVVLDRIEDQGKEIEGSFSPVEGYENDRYRESAEFSTESAADEWLKGKLNVTAPLRSAASAPATTTTNTNTSGSGK